MTHEDFGPGARRLLHRLDDLAPLPSDFDQLGANRSPVEHKLGARTLLVTSSMILVVLAAAGLWWRAASTSTYLSETPASTAAASVPSVVSDHTNVPQTAPTTATDSSRPIFPALGNIPEITAPIYATSVTFFKPPVTRMTLARIDRDRLIDVATISAVGPVGSDSGDVLIPPDAQISDGTVGGRDVAVYDNAGGRWYRWIDDGVVVLVEASTDSETIVSQLTATRNTDSWSVKLEPGALPDGLRIVAEPRPLVGNQPALSTNSEPGESILDLYPTDTPLLTGNVVVESYTIVDINGSVGYAAVINDGATVSWKTESGTWLRLSSSSTNKQRLTEIARDVQLVDRTSWNDRYDTSLDDVASTPATTTP